MKTTRRIDKVAEKYRQRGHKVLVIDANRAVVTDASTGHVYAVTASGRVVLPRDDEHPERAEADKVDGDQDSA